MSGKSSIMFEIISKRNIAFDVPMGKIYYCYGTYCNQYDIEKEKIGSDIIFISGLPSEDDVKKWATLSTESPIILVLDDLLEQVSKSVSCQNMVTKIAHHCEISLFILSQNMFQKGGVYRCLSLNTHYFILMKTKRDHQQILYFGRQIFPFKQNLLYSAYLYATDSVTYGYLRVDVHPASNPILALTTAFLEKYPIVYLDKNEPTDVKHLVI